jgi:hypothetical protein
MHLGYSLQQTFQRGSFTEAGRSHWQLPDHLMPVKMVLERKLTFDALNDNCKCLMFLHLSSGVMCHLWAICSRDWSC